MKFNAKMIVGNAWQNGIHGKELPLMTRLSFLLLLFLLPALIFVFLLSPLWVAIALFSKSFVFKFFALIIFTPITLLECYLVAVFIQTRRAYKKHLKEKSKILEV